MKDIDDRLLTAAYGLKFFADAYHDRVTDENSVSEKEYEEVLHKISEFAREIGVEYVYTVVAHKGKIVFTSDSPTKEEIEKDDYSKYFQEYKDASKGLKEAIRDKKIYYDEYADKWGDHRSIFLPTTSLNGSPYVVGVDIKISYLREMLRKVYTDTLLIALTVFVVSSLAVVLIARSITKPLAALARATEDVAKGNLDIEPPPVTSGDEVRKLSEAFQNMKISLKEYIIQLTETTASKERIESELKIAHNIQMNFLPKRFPPFPEKEEFEIFATLKPAREVGGDLYDFFLLDDDRLFFSIGDVSGKGVPAALLMAVTKTLMKRVAEQTIEPSETLTIVNRELCRNNESMMFVTVFLGVLNFKTGEFLFSNAGHHPPLIIRSGQKPEWLQIPKGFLLGVMEDAIYKTEKGLLNPGDKILLYTDGVTEAMNRDKVAYSNNRLMSTVEESKSTSADTIVREIIQSLREFTGDEPYSDDVTLLAVHLRGRKGT